MYLEDLMVLSSKARENIKGIIDYFVMKKRGISARSKRKHDSG